MANWNTAICKINGINLHYTRTGGNKPPLILLHGLITSGACWTPVAKALEIEYDVIMPDARGHGKSSKPDHGYQYQDHANDVVGLIEMLALSSPIVIGHSMGGMTAALVAGHMQKLLCGLIMVDPPFLSLEVQREVYASDVCEQHRQLLNKTSDEILAAARKRHPHRSLDILKLLTEARHQTSISAFQVLRPPYPEYKNLISAIVVPSLLVICEKGIVTLPMAEELRSFNPRLQIEKIPGVGHGLHYDQPERFITTVKSFLSSI
ncbi:MAG: alpha/beta hydrolase [Proteobacteria bacterium]|nr:alpha/beta hydrolase [Pseudomonadota bacterium]